MLAKAVLTKVGPKVKNRKGSALNLQRGHKEITRNVNDVKIIPDPGVMYEESSEESDYTSGDEYSQSDDENCDPQINVELEGRPVREMRLPGYLKDYVLRYISSDKQ